MKMIIEIALLTCAAFVLSIAISNLGDDVKEVTTYQAVCLDGIFSGEVEKRGDRYYYNDKQIWLPLSQCVLEEK